jgi:hypothetical protein
VKHCNARAWLNKGRAAQLPDAISEAFDKYLHSLQWDGTTGLDWSQLPASRRCNLADTTGNQLLEWARTTGVGRHTHLAIWYSKEEGGIVVPFDEGIIALDELYVDAPGPRFSFGADMEGQMLRPRFNDLLQYGNGDLLIAIA